MRLNRSALVSLFVVAAPFATSYAQASDLTQSCASVCPDATTTAEALPCVKSIEEINPNKFKADHPACYDAHARFEKSIATTEMNTASKRPQSLEGPGLEPHPFS
jgi:hypothetical protein